ncbi:MAG: hypothetical protein R3185_07585, partial [Candidatus Thermoplasmatota archaeon]|nr:hypothetical protein [Candidatus Thermoplasmatota archaeon]
MRTTRWRGLLLACLLVASLGAGCLSGDEGSTNGGGDGPPDEAPTAEIPRWELGFAWTYTIDTQGFPSTETTMLVYDDDGNNYRVGTTDEDQALIHALFNVNPQIGRIQKGNLAVYEDGEPRPMYDFPLTDGKTWETDFFVSQHGGTLTAEATYSDAIETGAGTMPGYEITATNPAGFQVAYDYIPAIQWFSKLVVL